MTLTLKKKKKKNVKVSAGLNSLNWFYWQWREKKVASIDTG